MSGISEELIIKRHSRLIKYHKGLPRPEIKNVEWLSILEEETRNSILIEGVFIDKKDLKKVIYKIGEPVEKSHHEAYNYYCVAETFYNWMYEASREGEFTIRNIDIKNIQSMLFVNIGDDSDRGTFRKSDIKITGAKIDPPSPFNLRDWFGIYIDYVNKHINMDDGFLDFIAKQHILFESMHPFADGNGRTGRIVTNGLLISNNYPPVIIKGDKNNKKRYYEALEEGDDILRPLTQKENITRKEVFSALDNMEISLMKDLITSSLKENCDKILISLMGDDKKSSLKPIKNLSQELNIPERVLTKEIKSGEYIAIKKGQRWYTNKDLKLKEMITLDQFLDLLNRYREKGVSESKVAEFLGYSKQYVNKIKLGKKHITKSFSDAVTNFIKNNT